MLAIRRCHSQEVFLRPCTSSIHLQSLGLFSNVVESRWQGQMGGRGTLFQITQINMHKVIKPTAPLPVWGGTGKGLGRLVRNGELGGRTA